MRERAPPARAQLGHPHKGQGQKHREGGGHRTRPPHLHGWGQRKARGRQRPPGDFQTPEPHSPECPPPTSLEEKEVREEGSRDLRIGYILP